MQSRDHAGPHRPPTAYTRPPCQSNPAVRAAVQAPCESSTSSADPHLHAASPVLQHPLPSSSLARTTTASAAHSPRAADCPDRPDSNPTALFPDRGPAHLGPYVLVASAPASSPVPHPALDPQIAAAPA